MSGFPSIVYPGFSIKIRIPAFRNISGDITVALRFPTTADGNDVTETAAACSEVTLAVPAAVADDDVVEMIMSHESIVLFSRAMLARSPSKAVQDANAEVKIYKEAVENAAGSRVSLTLPNGTQIQNANPSEVQAMLNKARLRVLHLLHASAGNPPFKIHGITSTFDFGW